MQDLTGRVMSNLVPSSMSAGNTTADDRKYSMSAPGSDSILPVPDAMDSLPKPSFTNSSQIPVGHPGQQESAAVQHSRAGGAQWVTKESTAGKWKVVP